MSRRPVARLCALVACALGLVAAAPAVADAPPEPLVGGVDVQIVWGDTAADVERGIDGAAALGGDVVRLVVLWSGLEPYEKGGWARWYLDLVDAGVDRAHRHGIKVLLTPVSTPCWASSGPADERDRCLAGTDVMAQRRPPADPGDYADLVAMFAARYADDLAGIEIWNEPNLADFWTTGDPAGAYAELLRAAYPAIKTAAPGVPVVAGALSGSDTDFLGSLYRAGIAGSYDVLSVHAYNENRAPWEEIDPRWAAATFLQGLWGLHAAMEAAGDRHPVWITEMGWNTSAVRDVAPWADGVTEEQQALYLSTALKALREPHANLGFVALALVYSLRDLGTDPQDPQANYGLLRHDGTPKPAFAAVRDTLAWAAAPPAPPLAPAAPAATPTATLAPVAPALVAPAAPAAPAVPAAPAIVPPVPASGGAAATAPARKPAAKRKRKARKKRKAAPKRRAHRHRAKAKHRPAKKRTASSRRHRH